MADAAAFVERLKEAGVLAMTVSQNRVRFVTHRDVRAGQILCKELTRPWVMSHTLRVILVHVSFRSPSPGLPPPGGGDWFFRTVSGRSVAPVIAAHEPQTDPQRMVADHIE